MTLQIINPESLLTPATYTHVIVATGDNNMVFIADNMVFIADQEPDDAQGRLVGLGDLAAQARRVFANLGRAVPAAGAQPGQVAKITIDVVHPPARVSASDRRGPARPVRRS